MRSVGCALLLVVVGCGEGPTSSVDAGTPVDGGGASDQGTHADAALLADAGSPRDASAGGDGGLLPPGVHPLVSMDVGAGVGDLAALEPLLEGVDVFGMGESVHTSGGYYRMKERVFRFLVEEQGFRAFAIESPWPDADVVAEYVATCADDPVRAVQAGLFGVWWAESVSGIARFMCDSSWAS